MSTITKTAVIDTAGAGSAKRWAGLQIDMAHKFRADQLSMDHVKWFLDLTKGERNKFLLMSLPVKATAEIAEEIYVHFIELDVSMLGLPKKSNSCADVIKLALLVLDLEPCSASITKLAQCEYRDLFFGIGFASRQEGLSRRIYFVSSLYLASVDLSGQE